MIISGEVVSEIEDIVEKRYPKDQTAGLYAACYTLNWICPIMMSGTSADYRRRNSAISH